MNEETQTLLDDMTKTLAPADLARLQANAARVAELQELLPELAAQHTAARAELEKAKLPVKAAETQVEAARAELTKARNASMKVLARLDSIRGQEQAARMELERLQADSAQRVPGLRPRPW